MFSPTFFFNKLLILLAVKPSALLIAEKIIYNNSIDLVYRTKIINLIDMYQT